MLFRFFKENNSEFEGYILFRGSERRTQQVYWARAVKQRL
jgi:hypothetical protein